MATKDICFCNAKHISLAGAAICFALATSCVWTRWICLSSARNQRPCRFQLRLDLARKDLYYDHSPAFSVKHRAAYELRHTHLCVCNLRTIRINLRSFFLSACNGLTRHRA